METLTAAKPLIDNPEFTVQKEAALSSLDRRTIDEPIRDVVRMLNDLSFCFTIQSCCGHFVFGRQNDPKNVEPLPQTDVNESIEYRIAYVALCVQKGKPAEKFLSDLSDIRTVDPQYIQYGSAIWFWERHVNSYVVQVEPERDSNKDTARINDREARYIEGLKRNVFLRIHSLAKSYSD